MPQNSMKGRAAKPDENKDGGILMGKERAFKSKSLLTLCAILSVLLAFSAVCAGCLWVLNRAGVFEFPARVNAPGSEKTGEAAVSLPVNTQPVTQAIPVLSGADALSALLAASPFSDSYYMSLSVETDGAGNSELPASGLYEIWRFGDKYKINRYNADNEIKHTVTCDGVRVQVTDFDAMSNRYYAYSPEYRFEQIAPLPDFARLMQQTHDVFAYTEADGVCRATWEYTTVGFIDEAHISMSDGMPMTFSRYKSGQVVWKLDVLSIDVDFPFTDEMFYVD